MRNVPEVRGLGLRHEEAVDASSPEMIDKFDEWKARPDRARAATQRRDRFGEKTFCAATCRIVLQYSAMRFQSVAEIMRFWNALSAVPYHLPVSMPKTQEWVRDAAL